MQPGFTHRNHPNMIKKRGVDDVIDDRESPPCLFLPLHAEFCFTLDAAANHHNAKCDKYCTLLGTFYRQPDGTVQAMGTPDGLTRPWCGETVYVNPPFSGVRPWVQKAWDEVSSTVVLVLPNNRAEQPFWSQLIEPYRDRPGSILTTRNLARRRPFLHNGKEIGNSTSKSPPFGICLVIWDRRRPDALARATPGH